MDSTVLAHLNMCRIKPCLSGRAGKGSGRARRQDCLVEGAISGGREWHGQGQSGASDDRVIAALTQQCAAACQVEALQK